MSTASSHNGGPTTPAQTLPGSPSPNSERGAGGEVNLRLFKRLNILRPVLVAFVAGWIVALAAGLVLARLQYAEVVRAFPLERATAEYETRLDREIRQGPLLLLAQVGVMAGALAWQVGQMARRSPHPLLHGALAGLVLAAIQSAFALAMHVPLSFVVPLVAVLIGAGIYGAWSSVPLQQ
jgi:type III secretory pathway component EscS